MLNKRETKGEYTFNILVREHWYEWFMFKIPEGEYFRFFFPIKKDYRRCLTVCWVWYLVPFVLVYELIAQFILGLYLGLREMLYHWEKSNEQRIKK